MRNRTLQYTTFITIHLIAIWAPYHTYAQIAVPKDRTTMAVAAEGYLSNLESFPNLFCRFIVSDHQVNTLADALAGRFGAPTMINEGLLIRRGNKERYRLGCPPEVLAQLMEKSRKDAERKGKTEAFVPCIDANVLVNGHYKLEVASMIHVADVYSSDDGPQPRRSTFLSPVTLGDMTPPNDPGTLLREAVAGKIYGRYEGMQDVDGRKAMVFAIGESADKITHKFYLDSERGFLPLRHEILDPVRGTRVHLSFFTSFRACSGGRWYPERGVDVIKLWDEGRTPIIAREVKVTYLDVDTPTRDEDFAILIPAGHQVKNPQNIKDGAAYIEKADHRVTAEEIPQVVNKLQELTEKIKKEGLAFQARKAVVSRGRWAKVTIVLLLVGAGAFILWRRVRWRSSSTHFT